MRVFRYESNESPSELDPPELDPPELGPPDDGLAVDDTTMPPAEEDDIPAIEETEAELAPALICTVALAWTDDVAMTLPFTLVGLGVTDKQEQMNKIYNR